MDRITHFDSYEYTNICSIFVIFRIMYSHMNPRTKSKVKRKLEMTLVSSYEFWFMTSNVRTHGCRYRTYCMLCVGVWLEMKFSDLYLSIRALVFGLNLTILCVECWSYRDLISENNALLRKLLEERMQPAMEQRPICGIKLSMMGKLYGKKKSFHYEY